jgi:7 transmembrane receptor (rhodopsin family)
MSSHNGSAGFTDHDVNAILSAAGHRSVTASPVNILTHLIDRFESRDPAILKAGLLFAVAIPSLFGNGASMAVIWKTPKLHTKTFALLFNLAAVDLLEGLVLVWYGAYHLIVYVFNEDPCRYLVLEAIMSFVPRYPVYLSMNSVGLIAYERYIAIVRPLRYETAV